jgi:hypothetical protein
MTPTAAPDQTSAGSCRLPRGQRRRRLPAQRRPPSGARHRGRDERRLAAYELDGCAAREIVERPGAHGSRLVVDCEAGTHRDDRLVAHLACDEPSGNAEVVCASYLAALPAAPPRCRRMTEDDLAADPLAAPPRRGAPDARRESTVAVGSTGRSYRIEAVAGRMRIPELRWCRVAPTRAVVSLREVVGDAEDYQPACATTELSLQTGPGAGFSTATLAVELARVQRSAIVLNRRLREAVVTRLAADELSMSAIAMRCGRIKRDSRARDARARVGDERLRPARRLQRRAQDR